MISETLSARTSTRLFYALTAVAALVLAVGLGAAYYMEERGHVVTGMTNQVVWGLPHVFAIFLIVAASGVVNVASIGSVFGKPAYKVRAPLAGLLCLAMLAGGLMVLMLDLGRPDRLIVAATHYNFTSVFAWNVFLYSGMTAIVAMYLWTLMERRMNPYAKAAGFAAFVFRLILTTGTGAIFAFLAARQAYGSALLPPLFIVMSFGWGLAVFLLVQAAMLAWNGLAMPEHVERRMRRLLGVFVAATLYFVAAHHLTNAYFAKQLGFEHFILFDGGVYPALFWLGYVGIGSVVPLALIYAPAAGPRAALAASALVIAGAFCELYVFIIGGQAYPLELFPGMAVESTFFDGAIASYAPSLPELLLGLGGVAAALLITAVGARALEFLPRDTPASAAAD